MRAILFGFILYLCQIAIAFSPLDTNDVSILLPRQNGQIYPVIQLDDDRILTMSIFNQILNFENVDHRPDFKNSLTNKELVHFRKNWRLTSFRFEPCGIPLALGGMHNSVPILTKANSLDCSANIRLVFQPFTSTQIPLASALHLTYKLTPRDSELVVEQLVSIKQDSQILTKTSGKPLQIHPGLENESKLPSVMQTGLDGPIAIKLKNMLFQFTQTKNLAIATATLSVGVKKWKLVGGTILNESWIKFVSSYTSTHFIDTNVEDTGVEIFGCTFLDICSVYPRKSAHLTDQTDFNAIFEPGRVLQPKEEKKNHETLKLAEIIDNPIKTNFLSTNCISCHVSANYRDRSTLIDNNISEETYPSGITPFTERKYTSESASQIINFGYFGSEPRISTRVANESALVANYINKLYNEKNPGYKPLNLKEFWGCLMMADSFKNCIQEDFFTF